MRALAPLLLVDLERRLLGRYREAGVAEPWETGNQRVVTEALPALTRIPERDHDPPVIRGTGNVVGLPLWETPVRRMDPTEPRLVLLLGATGEPVDDGEWRHAVSPLATS